MIFLIIFILLFPNTLLAYKLKVIRVYNGDTIKAKGNGTVIKVRLAGIDAPECSLLKRKPDQPYGRESRSYLEDLILNKVVEIEYSPLRSSNLFLGEVFLAGKNINLEMVRSGFAEVYQWNPLKRFDLLPFIHAQNDAKASEKGMWIQGDNYESPRMWRERIRRRLTRFLFYGIQKGKK